MARFQITGPDGKSYEITAPDDASDDDVMSFVQSQMGAPKESLSWADVPGQALGNLGTSAKNFAYNVTAPIHSPVETAKGLGHLAAGIGSKIVGAADTVSQAVGGPVIQDPAKKAYAEAPLKAVGGFLKDRYGSAEGLKNTLATDPVGAMGDAAMLLYGGGATLPGRVGAAAKTAGAVVDPIRITGKALNLSGKGVGKLASVAAGQSTGAQSLPFELAFKAGRYGSETFAPNMRGYGVLDDVAKRADDAVGQLVKERSNQYNTNNPLTSMRGMMKPLNMDAVDRALADASKLGVRRDVITNQRTADVVNEIRNVVESYKERGWTTAKDLDELKQIVYDLGGSEKQGTRAHKAAMNIYNTIKSEVSKQVPGYKSHMSDYANASDLIKQMRTELSLNNRSGAGTKLRKLQSAMRNNATTANGKRTQLVNELSRIDSEIPYSLSGQSLNSAAPRGLQGAGALGVAALAIQNPMMALMLPFMSPRLMGEVTYGAGKVARGFDNINRAGLTPQMLARILLTSRAAGAATDPTSE